MIHILGKDRVFMLLWYEDWALCWEVLWLSKIYNSCYNSTPAFVDKLDLTPKEIQIVEDFNMAV
jgi:hypothetical protein